MIPFNSTRLGGYITLQHSILTNPVFWVCVLFINCSESNPRSVPTFMCQHLISTSFSTVIKTAESGWTCWHNGTQFDLMNALIAQLFLYVWFESDKNSMFMYDWFVPDFANVDSQAFLPPLDQKLHEISIEFDVTCGTCTYKVWGVCPTLY